MNFIKTIQANWTRVALSAIALTTLSSYGSNSVTLIKQSASFIVKIEQELSKFFNKSNNTPYNTITLSLGKILSEFEQNIDHTKRSHNDKFSEKAYSIAQEARKHFNAAYGVIKEYNGKSSQYAGNFVNDLSCVFDAEVAFNNISIKLIALLEDATAENDTELVHVIQQVISVLEKKKNEWSKKGKPTLLLGLTIRMSK
jgi:hypothetical protein